MTYTPPPKPCFLDTLESFGVRDGRKVWRDDDRYYTWDSQHAEIEVFDKRGWHLGVLDAVDGTAVKDAVKGRRLNV
ncbi:MAG: hypothetical protein JWO77_3047 [Ilumatobacteraceae bacterium]|nr:hypothetical protein [Ilumatobacteraceae bacterium]